METPRSNELVGTPTEPSVETEPLASAREIVRAEYVQMPGLSLTLAQAVRLWSLDRPLCEQALETLVHEGFLQHSADGMYRVSRLH